jgi:hypothetical protein
LAAIFQNREADLAWPERGIGKTVPAFEQVASSSSSAMTTDYQPMTSSLLWRNENIGVP